MKKVFVVMFFFMSFAVGAKPTLDNITIEKFIDRYHEAMLTLGYGMVIDILKENDNGEFITAQLNSNKGAGFVISVDNKTRKLRDIMFVAPFPKEKGDPALFDMLFGSTAIIMALENPKMSQKKRAELVGELGFSDTKGRSFAKDFKFKRKGWNYSYTPNLGNYILTVSK